MSNRTLNLTDPLYQYLLDLSLREHPVLAALREATRSHPKVNMQISPEQGQFMQWLVQLMGATRTLEVGVFTGYSALAVALVLPADGEVIACDVSEEWTSLAKPYWQQAGVAQRIRLELRPALETLEALIREGRTGQFDFAFIDADKANYAAYVDACWRLLRRGGVIAIDNVLWNGAVIDFTKQDADTRAIRALNRALHEDRRFAMSLLPVGDGLTLLRKL